MITELASVQLLLNSPTVTELGKNININSYDTNKNNNNKNIWTGPKCVCVYKYIDFMMFDNPSLRKRHYELVKYDQNIGVSSNKKGGKNHPMVPPLDLFQGKHKNCSSFARTFSTSRGSFFANLINFQLRSVIGPEEMSILVWGQRKRPQLKWNRPKTYKFWQSPHFQNP